MDELLEVVTIECVGIYDGLLNVRGEGMSVGMVCGEVGVVEGGMLWISAKLNTARANRIGDDSNKVMWFAWMGIHLLLLCDASGLEFLMRADGWDFDVRLMRS